MLLLSNQFCAESQAIYQGKKGKSTKALILPCGANLAIFLLAVQLAFVADSAAGHPANKFVFSKLVFENTRSIGTARGTH
jgi:hypothetical protein